MSLLPPVLVVVACSYVFSHQGFGSSASFISCIYIWELSKCSQVRGGNRNLNDANNQGNMMIEQFKYALINDSDQLFTLQKVFLLPHPVDGAWIMFGSNGYGESKSH